MLKNRDVVHHHILVRGEYCILLMADLTKKRKTSKLIVQWIKENESSLICYKYKSKNNY